MITNRTKDISECDFTAGEVVLIDKAKGKTSFNAVHRVRKAAGVKKVGHAGTLDPAATGLLILCTGKKTREIYKYQESEKEYTGTITLGKRTPSMDSETEVSETGDISGITEADIFSARDKFTGKIEQVPPMYSALKHKGKALYKYARKGEEIKREPRLVTVYDFDITSVEMPEVKFRIRCSKGTYIRVIADDFGRELGCGGFLSELRRTAIGEYRVEDALTADDFAGLFETTEHVNNVESN